MPSVQAINYQVGVVGQPCAFGPTVSKRYNHAQQPAALSSTLASRRSEQQNKINNAVALQNSSEEDWLQSVHAEADAEAQSRPQSRVHAPTRPSTSRFHQADGPRLRLDRTQLGRNMLQRKVDNFSEMVALVAPPQQLPPEAPTAAQRPHTQQPIAPYAATAYKTPAAPPSSAHPPKGPTLSSNSAEKQAALRNTSNFSKARLIPDGTVYNPLVPATAISDPHLRRLHDTATAWKHSLRQQPDLSSLDTATAAQEAALAQPDTVSCRPPGRFSSQVPPVRVSSVFRSDQKQPFVAAQANTSRNTGLQQLQEPPAERQYRLHRMLRFVNQAAEITAPLPPMQTLSTPQQHKRCTSA